MQYFGFDRPSFGIKTFGFGTNFDPLVLFAGGKQGAWYDPSDKSTLFQDATGTIPVTKDGDPVGLMKDKSGNGNHAKQTVSTARPIYKTDGVLHWLLFDGVDDSLDLGVLPFSSVSLALGWDALDSKKGILLRDKEDFTLWKFAYQEGSTSTDMGAGNPYRSIRLQSGLTKVTNATRGNVFAAMTQSPHSQVWRIPSTPEITNTTTFGGYPTSGFALKGRLFGLVYIGHELTDNSTDRIAEYMSKKAGVTL